MALFPDMVHPHVWPDTSVPLILTRVADSEQVAVSVVTPVFAPPRRQPPL